MFAGKDYTDYTDQRIAQIKICYSIPVISCETILWLMKLPTTGVQEYFWIEVVLEYKKWLAIDTRLSILYLFYSLLNHTFYTFILALEEIVNINIVLSSGQE